MTQAEVRTPWPLAMGIADEIIVELRPFCDRIEVAGSLRRRRETVKDIEVLVIPRFGEPPRNLLGEPTGPAPDWLGAHLQEALKVAVPSWKLRPSKVGGTSFGVLNKLLLRRTRPGFPSDWLAVDVFTATAANWGRDMWVRTGPAAWNKATATLALRRGGRFHAYGPHAFSRGAQTWDAPDEASFARWLGVPLLPPDRRTDEAAEWLLTQ